MSDPKIKSNINYLKILSQKLQSVPAWRDYALACNEVLGKEVDDRRRLLAKMRDSVKYRRGDTITNFTYIPEPDKLAVNEYTRETVDIPVGTKINEANVKNVIHNIAFFKSANDTDYLDLSFNYKGTPVRWLMPVNAVQEREILLKNSYIMGFDFFNTTLSDEDLKRVYEYIQLYWNESGSDDNFIKFIGFIKNTRFDLVPLWTETPNGETPSDPDAEYPYLEPWNSEMVSVKDGGNNWLTSHAEIEFDLAQFEKFYVVNLDDLEQLFYYFAPINLVLERVTGRLNLETTIETFVVNSVSSYQIGGWEPEKEFTTSMKLMEATHFTSTEIGKFNPTLEFKTDVRLGVAYNLHSYNPGCYDLPQELVSEIDVAVTNSTLVFCHAVLNTNDKTFLGLDYIVDLRNKNFNFVPYVYSTTGA